MKRYLVTGAAGFIGANFLKYLLKSTKKIYMWLFWTNLRMPGIWVLLKMK